jgi:macrolide-specific efflux system membrane fusion protein
VQPENRLEIKPPIPGRVEEVLVDEGQQVKPGQILAWMSSSERAGLLDAARARGPEELKRWQEFYKPTPILAPISGTIIQRNVEPGQTFTSQDAVLVMSDRLTVKAQVDETDIAQIALKQQSEIVLDAYPDQPVPAEVVQLAFDAKTVNNVTTYVVDVLPKTVPAFMRSGMTANVVFHVGEKKDIMLLPSEAIKTKDGKSYVLLKAAQPGQKNTEQEVSLGASDGKQVEITVGVNAEQVVLIPQLKAAQQTLVSPFSPFGAKKK